MSNAESAFPKIVTAGADAILVYLGEGIDPEVNDRIMALTNRVSSALGNNLYDLVPSYNSLMIYYNVLSLSEDELRECVRKLIDELQQDGDASGASKQSALHTIDVYYDPSVGPDLERAAEQTSLSIDGIIKMHTEQEYRVYAMGFAPGFAYLGELPEKLRLPRLDNPRTKIPAGSVAIAEAQTAVYPSVSPGGWNIIGRTAETLYDPQADNISPMKVGDRVQFKAVSKDEFEQAGGSLESLS
ncbi:5-oxoprolinase subunit PxpB [Idiomarina piscisalsi]|uniref:Allophanate hydrolase subunit 1 n=1 Tax=Idiomarina piscisalsi TaxID=1096243 RepID=A0A432YWW8_9GAMM|nr:5-oxoprolinase subunit PxpB [Idiomarina piscisalsi]RUO67819.1 allophanate hydrolase subunit 1 [Idiomarina piscisalsi]